MGGLSDYLLRAMWGIDPSEYLRVYVESKRLAAKVQELESRLKLEQQRNEYYRQRGIFERNSEASHD